MPTQEPLGPREGAITHRRDGDNVHVLMIGAIDTRIGTEIADELGATETAGTIVVDAGGVTFMDSIGLTVLLQLRHYAGRGVRLVGPSDAVVRLLELTGTDSLFTVE